MALSMAPFNNLAALRAGAQITGDTPSWYGSNPAAYGSRPAPVTPVATAPANVGTAMNLGNQVYGQLPGYQQSLGNVGANIQSETAGELPADVVTQIEQGAAERGVATGAGVGSPNLNASLLRALGLTSLNLTNMGQQNLNQQLGMLPGAQVYQNPAFYPTTAGTYEAGVQNSLNAAAPDPFAAANANLRAAAGGYAAGRGSGPLNLGGSNSDTLGQIMRDYSGTVYGGSTGGGTYYNGVWYPEGSGPTSGGVVEGNAQGGSPADIMTQPTAFDIYSQGQQLNDLFGNSGFSLYGNLADATAGGS